MWRSRKRKQSRKPARSVASQDIRRDSRPRLSSRTKSGFWAADAKPGELRSPAQPGAAVPTCEGATYGGFEIGDCFRPDGALQEAGGCGSRTGGAAERRAGFGQALRLSEHLLPPRAASHGEFELLHRRADCGDRLRARSSAGIFGGDAAVQGRSVEEIRSDN